MPKHKEYKNTVEKWKYAIKSYTGDYLNDLSTFLPKNKQRESDAEYQQRKDFLDPVLPMPTVIDSINGMVPTKDTNREWGELGDPQEEGTIAYQLFRNINGAGLNWEPFFKQVGIKQTVFHTVWGLVDGKDGVKLLSPVSVPNWYPSSDPDVVRVNENRDTRDSIKDKDEDDKQYYVLYRKEGWERYIEKEESDQLVASDTYEYYKTSKKKERILPIFRVRLPLPRNIGWLLAHKQQHILNQKSSRDWGAYILSFALLKIAAENKDQYEEVVKTLADGSNAIMQLADVSNEHSYISPDGGHLQHVTEILQKEREAFFEAAFKQYGDAAKQLTATQIMQESRTGIESFLELLVGSIDQFENAALKRLEQVYFPDNPSVWGEASVHRSRDFAPVDSDEVLKNLKSNFPNNKVPMTSAVAEQMIKKAYNLLNVEVEDEDELQALAQNIINQANRETDLTSALGLQ